MSDVVLITKLKCECGSELFAPLVTLNWKTGGGTTSTPSGYKCAQCDMNVDSGYLTRRAELVEKKRAAQSALEEVEALTAVVDTPKKITGNRG